MNELIKHQFNLNAAIQYKNRSGCTALHVACAVGNSDAIYELIRTGACMDVFDARGRTPLDYARRNGNKEIMGVLTPFLIKAIPEGNTDFLKSIFRAGMSVSTVIDVPDLGKCQLLHLACKASNLSTIELLLSLGAKVNTKDCFGKTALDYVQEKQRQSIISCFEKFLGRKL